MHSVQGDHQRVSEVYEEQPDGRLVAGPALQAPRERSRTGPALVAVVVALVASFAAGRYTAPDLHDRLVERLEAGCIVTYRAVSTDDLGAGDVERDAEEAVRVLEASGATSVRATLHEATPGVTRLDPTATRLGLVSWETCS